MIGRYDKRLRALYQKHERLWMPGMLLAGTVFDAVTFHALEIRTTFVLLGVYLAVAAAAIVYTHCYDGARVPPHNTVLRYLRVVAPPILQFVFGALLSMSLLFYWFGGSLSASWPMLGIMALLMASNEIFRNFFLRSTVQMAVYAFILFAYCSLLFPFVFNSLSAWVFLLAGGVSTVLMLFFIFTLARLTPLVERDRSSMVAASVMVFVVMTGLYFLNVIPPIPLSLRDAGVYHDIVRENGEYTLVGDEETWLARRIPGRTFLSEPWKPVYVYTAIFAPAQLSTTIYHEWQFYNQATGKWEARDRLSFDISGGRDAGYRGYSRKSSLTPGKWRVSVETARGQVLGRIPFTFVVAEE